VYFLIPPSEGKTPATTGGALNLKKLPFAELNAKRNEMIDALVALATHEPAIASKALGLGPTQGDQLDLDRSIRTAHCAAASEIYTGVLFDHLGYHSLTARAKEIAQQSILISSALFGFVFPQSPIPAYRLSGSTVLPGIGPLGGFWKPELAQVVDTLAKELIVDMRSGTYSKLAPLPHREDTIEVKVMTLVKGIRKSVTHFNKATKGDLLRASVSSTRKFPQHIGGLDSYFRQLGFTAEIEVTQAGRPELIILTQ
jgi:cytoplasmic iron level regulating protein YaaA (DUF328/UPF0246 family)